MEAERSYRQRDVRSTRKRHRGRADSDTIYQMMQVTGEEGVTLDDYVTWQKATLVDMVYLQQDAFDETDAAMPRERQVASFALLCELVGASYEFTDKDAAREFFTQLTSLYRNYNDAASGSDRMKHYVEEIRRLARGATLADTLHGRAERV